MPVLAEYLFNDSSHRGLGRSRHHHRKAQHRADGGDVRARLQLRFGDEFLDDHIDHSPGGERQSIGQNGAHQQDSRRAEHARDGRWRAQAKDSCTTCHDEENSPNFDYATYWEKIKH